MIRLHFATVLNNDSVAIWTYVPSLSSELITPIHISYFHIMTVCFTSPPQACFGKYSKDPNFKGITHQFRKLLGPQAGVGLFGGSLQSPQGASAAEQLAQMHFAPAGAPGAHAASHNYAGESDIHHVGAAPRGAGAFRPHAEGIAPSASADAELDPDEQIQLELERELELEETNGVAEAAKKAEYVYRGML
jgi:hypothetical protein